MSAEAPTDRDVVVALLAMHGLRPAPAEVDLLVECLPQARADVEALRRIVGAAEVVPAVIFDPRA